MTGSRVKPMENLKPRWSVSPLPESYFSILEFKKIEQRFYPRIRGIKMNSTFKFSAFEGKSREAVSNLSYRADISWGTPQADAFVWFALAELNARAQKGFHCAVFQQAGGSAGKFAA